MSWITGKLAAFLGRFSGRGQAVRTDGPGYLDILIMGAILFSGIVGMALIPQWVMLPLYAITCLGMFGYFFCVTFKEVR